MVGLVEDRDLDGVEAHVALADEVLEATGAGDDDVDALADRGDLGVLADAAEDGAGAQPGGRGQGCEGLLDLGDELTRRREDQGARGLGTARGTARGQPRDEWQQEGIGLARAGAPAAQDVASGEGVGQRRGLDGSGAGDPALGEDRDEGGGHAERAEGGAHG